MIIEANSPDVTQYAAQYELLRSQVIGTRGGEAAQPERATQPHGVGLALMLREGMPGWLNAVAAVIRASQAERTTSSGQPSASASARSAACGVTSPWPSGVQRHDVTTLLTSLVLSTHHVERSSQKEGYRCQ